VISFVIAAVVMLVALVPAGVVIARGTLADAVVGFEFITAVAVMVFALLAFRERHVKRLLAFSTISHAGMFLAGFALLTPLGLAGAALAVVGHAFVRGALFLGAGIGLHRLHSVNETWLHGRGKTYG
jgi:multicomponent Na+:H+ antiporter subunit D